MAALFLRAHRDVDISQLWYTSLMIVDCPGCNLSYDLSGYKPNQRLRCRCGQLLVVPKSGPTQHIAHTIHCSNCGGKLEKGRPDCPYCGSMIDLTHSRMKAYCPTCLAMSKEGAKFCSECGKPFVRKLDAPEEAAERCPHCNVRMRRRDIGKHKPLECPICCGLFVAADELSDIVTSQESRIGTEGGAGQTGGGGSAAGPVVYIKCPICSKVMNRMNYQRVSKVIVDFCRDHGYWLDAGELEKIASWVASGGIARKYAREVEELKSERQRLSKEASFSGHLSTNVTPVFSERDSSISLFGFVVDLFK